MSKLSVLIASFAALPVLAIATTVSATGAGQVEGGDIYRVRNVTTNSAFADPTSAKCNETVQFKVRIHNPGPSRLDNVNVVATLPSVAAASHVSKVTVSSPYADPTSTSDTATVNLDKAGKLAYVAGSTELLDAHNGKIKTLGDTITSTGVKVDGGVGVSIEEKRFVQFSAKVTCDTPQAPTYTCDLLNIKAEEGRNVTVTEFKTSSANGAVFKHAVLNWGDNSAAVTTANAVGQKHQYAADGTYTVKATAVFTVDGKEVSNTNANCSKVVTFVAEKPPVVTPPETPEVLVNTGAGSILGLFAAITVAGALAHRLVWTRIRG